MSEPVLWNDMERCNMRSSRQGCSSIDFIGQRRGDRAPSPAPPTSTLRSRVVCTGIVFLLGFASSGEARAQDAKFKMCSWIDGIAVLSPLTATDMRRGNSIQRAMARQLKERMNERILERAIKQLSRKSLKHVNKPCSGLWGDSETQGWTPLLMAALKLSDRHLPVFRHLLENKADVGLRVPAREERLAGAAPQSRKGNKSLTKAEMAALVSLIRSSQAEPDPRYEGATALHIAVDKPGTVSVAALLIENGAEISDTTIAGATALHFASARGDIATLELLLEHEADVEARDDRGHTALHYAAAEGSNARAVMMLIDLAGADTLAVTDAGETAYDLIMQNPKLKGSAAVAALEPN